MNFAYQQFTTPFAPRTWERKHGRAPTSRELLHIANAATLQSRKGKDAGTVDWDALARRWDATLGGDLAAIAPAVSDARGPQVQTSEHHAGRAPSGPPAPEAQARVLAKALSLVSARHPAWTRHDLLKHLALVLPAKTRQMNPEEARELLLGLAEEALSGRDGQVVCLEAPQWPPLSTSLRQMDGRSIYTRPGAARYATATPLSRTRPDGTQRLDLPADAHSVRRQRPRRPCPPQLRPHHGRQHLTPPRKTPPGGADTRHQPQDKTVAITQGQRQHSAESPTCSAAADYGRGANYRGWRA